LKEWFYQHEDDPYPSTGEKKDLADKTGLSLQQIQNWFINARCRIWNGKDDEDFLKQLEAELKKRITTN